MAVLVEGLSVVVRRAAIDDHMIGGWDHFLTVVPNATLCTDGEVVRVGFLSPDAVGEFLGTLGAMGLVFLRDGIPTDVSVVDQRDGPTVPTSWLQFGRVSIARASQVALCWLFEGPRQGEGLHMKSRDMDVVMPMGWTFEGSLSERHEFQPTASSN